MEVYESYFGGYRKGKRGRGAAGKIPVFGLLKPDSIVYSDSLPSYNALDVSGFKHFRINHSKGFASDKITSMELRIFGIKQSAI